MELGSFADLDESSGRPSIRDRVVPYTGLMRLDSGLNRSAPSHRDGRPSMFKRYRVHILQSIGKPPYDPPAGVTTVRLFARAAVTTDQALPTGTICRAKGASWTL